MQVINIVEISLKIYLNTYCDEELQLHENMDVHDLPIHITKIQF